MMKSKECLEDIKLILYENLEFHMDVDELIEPINQDLDRLEKLEKVIEILNKYPKMINDSVRFDSPYGIQSMLGVSKEEAEEIKKGYRLLKELIENA